VHPPPITVQPAAVVNPGMPQPPLWILSLMTRLHQATKGYF